MAVSDTLIFIPFTVEHADYNSGFTNVFNAQTYSKVYVSSTTAGDYIQFRFFGNTLALLFNKGPGFGIAQVFVDDELKATVDLYSTTFKTDQLVIISENLGPGEHVVKIVNSGNKNPSSGGIQIDVCGMFVEKIEGLVDLKLMPYKVSAAGSLQTLLSETNIALPIDKQYIYRTQLLNYTTNLAAGATFTSSSYNILNYKRVTGYVFMDQSGTLEIQESKDGSTWRTVESISVSANTVTIFNHELLCEYVRFRLTNTGGADTTVMDFVVYASVE